MSKIEDGGPAFPLNSPSGSLEYMPARDGMSLRDWFAGQALVGLTYKLLSNEVADLSHCVKAGGIEARAAYQLADAMLDVRKANGGES